MVKSTKENMQKIQILFFSIGIVGSLVAMQPNQKKEKIEAEVETQKSVMATKVKTEESLQELCISLMIFNAKKERLHLDHFHVLNLSGLNKLRAIVDIKNIIKKFVDTEREIMGEEKAYQLLNNMQLRNKFDLIHLILSHNKIEKLPEEIGQLTTLRQLDLRSNLLQTVPASIGNLTQLTKLHLESNPLQYLPKGAIAKLRKTCFYYTDKNDKPWSTAGEFINSYHSFPFQIK